MNSSANYGDIQDDLTDDAGMQQSATVIEVRGDTAWVEAVSRSACTACGSSGCSSSVLASLFGNKRNRLQLDNRLQARVGDRVVISIPQTVLVKASLWAYLLPIAGMLLVTGLARVYGAPESLQALAALFGLAASLYAVRRITGNARATQRFAARIVKIENRGSVTLAWPAPAGNHT